MQSYQEILLNEHSNDDSDAQKETIKFSWFLFLSLKCSKEQSQNNKWKPLRLSKQRKLTGQTSRNLIECGNKSWLIVLRKHCPELRGERVATGTGQGAENGHRQPRGRVVVREVYHHLPTTHMEHVLQGKHGGHSPITKHLHPVPLSTWEKIN